MLVAFLIVYSVGLIALGFWFSRSVRRSDDFFVANRTLGAGLIFSTFLAANIGAGSTVGATGLAYTDGWAAWWWNGSAGIGSLVLAFWIGPRVWREASEHGFLSVGDFLEHHFGRGVRGLAALSIWLGSFVILCGQLRGAAEVLQRAAGLSLETGAALAAIITALYFSAGGMMGAARINVIQLVIIVVGFLMAAPYALEHAGGAMAAGQHGSFWRGERVGWPSLLLLGPAFFLSPGLLQKAYAARSADAVRRGVGLNALALMAFAVLPVLLGLAARALYPGLERPEMALPAILTDGVPTLVGGFALAAVFSAELSTADAVLAMLASSGARDFYRGFIRPSAADAEVLRVARVLALAGCVVGYLLTFVFDSVASALTMFYSIMVVTLFAPTMGALFLPKAGGSSARAAMLVGVATLFTVHVVTGGAGYGWVSPSLLGILTSGLTYLILAVF